MCLTLYQYNASDGVNIPASPSRVLGYLFKYSGYCVTVWLALGEAKTG